MMKQIISATVLLSLLAPPAHPEERDVYVIKPGDNLSRVARKYLGGPIYSPFGTLARLLKMNPKIDDPNKIFVGQKIYIGSAREFSRPKISSGERACEARGPSTEPSEVAQPLEVKTETNKSELKTVEQTSLDQEIPHRFEFGANDQLTTLSGSSSGVTANLHSSHDLSLFAAWMQEWSESFSTALGGKFRSVDIEPSTNSSKSISRANKSVMGILFSVEGKISRKLALTFGANYESQLFFHGLNSNALVVDAVPIPDFSVGAKFLAYERGKTSFGLSGSVDYLMSATTDGFSVDSGFAYQGKLFIRRKYGTDSISQNSVELGLGYQDRSQNTSVLNFHEKSVGATLLFSIPLFQ